MSVSDAVSVPITVHCVGEDPTDPDGAWAAATGLRPDGAILVRPDDFVGWRADEIAAEPEAELRQALSAILARG